MSSASGGERFSRLDGRAGVDEFVSGVSYCCAGDASIAERMRCVGEMGVVQGCDDLVDRIARHVWRSSDDGAQTIEVELLFSGIAGGPEGPPKKRSHLLLFLTSHPYTLPSTSSFTSRLPF